jgi:hypothetical protein
MAGTDVLNRLRLRSILLAREFKGVFHGAPERVAAMVAGVIPGTRWRRWLWRMLFMTRQGEVHPAGQVVLAELRREGGLDRKSIFHPDPVVMAYRQGKRDVVMMIFNYLALDEGQVQQLMELDDGYGE